MPYRPARFADLHTHTSLKSYLARNSYPDVWAQKRVQSPFQKQWKRAKTDRYTQSDVQTLKDGNVRLVVNAFHPLEKSVIRNWLKRVGNKIIATGLSQSELEQSLRESYYHHLTAEYELLTKGQALTTKGEFKIARSATDILNLETTTNIISLISIEGAHSLLDDENPPTDSATLLKKLEDRLTEIRSTFPRLAYFTVAHAEYNYVLDHALTLLPDSELEAALLNLFTSIPGPKGTGLSPHGVGFIRLLLGSSNTDAILVDVKHMSWKARQEYYALLRTPEFSHRDIPIVASHTGFAQGAFTEHSHLFDRPRSISKNQLLYEATLNIDATEIRAIADSRGLIGLIADQRVLGCNNMSDTQRQWTKGLGLFSSQEKWAKTYFNYHLRMFAHSLLYGLRIMQTREQPLRGWDVLCMGTDFDGMIDPIQCLPTAEYFPLFAEHLYNLLEQDPDFEPVRRDFTTPAQPLNKCLDKLFYRNIEHFYTQRWPLF